METIARHAPVGGVDEGHAAVVDGGLHGDDAAHRGLRRLHGALDAVEARDDQAVLLVHDALDLAALARVAPAAHDHRVAAELQGGQGGAGRARGRGSGTRMRVRGGAACNRAARGAQRE